MSAVTSSLRFERRQALWPRVLRAALIALAMLLMVWLLVLPLAAIVAQALQQGAGFYLHTLVQPDTRSAVWLTVLVAVIVVPFNVVFGIAAAWLITHFRFPGRSALVALIDLPFSVSPVVAGMMLVLVFGQYGWFGGWLQAHGAQIIFAVPGVVLATLFVTLPFVARTLLPLMQAQGSAEEEAALTLGAHGWQILWHVTLPRVRWALLHGVLLCNARAMGEFGAVYVVSGHLAGLTNTLPLEVDQLYQENVTAAFAVATLLAALTVFTLLLKRLLEWQQHRFAAAIEKERP